MPAVARIGDVVAGECDGPGHPVHRPFTGVWVSGSDVAIADGMGIVRVGDVGVTDCGHNFTAITGSDVSSIDGIPVHRVNDVVEVVEGGSGVTITGSDVTFLDE